MTISAKPGTEFGMKKPCNPQRQILGRKSPRLRAGSWRGAIEDDDKRGTGERIRERSPPDLGSTQIKAEMAMYSGNGERGVFYLWNIDAIMNVAIFIEKSSGEMGDVCGKDGPLVGSATAVPPRAAINIAFRVRLNRGRGRAGNGVQSKTFRGRRGGRGV